MKINKIIGGAGDMFDAKPTSAQENLYLSVNGEWQETAKIPADKPRTGGFMDLDEAVEKSLMKEFEDFSTGKVAYPNELVEEAIKLYRVANDAEKQSKFHQQPILKDLQTIIDIKDIEDFSNKIVELSKSGYALPIDIDIDADMKDTTKNVVYIDVPGLILPDKTYYDEDNDSKEKLLSKYTEVVSKLLSMVGYDLEKAKSIVEQAKKFDSILVPIVKSSEEKADYTKMYNPMYFDEYTTKSKYLDLKSQVVGQINDTPEKVIIIEPRYVDSLDDIINADNFELMKSWMIVKLLMSNAGNLDEEFRQTVGEYSLALNGAKELQNRTKFAFHKATGYFSQIIGLYYGEKYFGASAKADVKKMIEKMTAIYKDRLANNSWLGEETKKKAIHKLDMIEVKVGYPDKIDDIYKKYKIDENISLYENISNLRRIIIQDHLDQYSKPVDRSKWLMPGHMVNACYDPSRNDITFPAAILQAPFYSLDQTSSQNYGGIGAVIAHEISHAFDNNGSQFDEYGNMNNWWTDEDYAKFKELTQKMIDEFDGIPYAGSTVNGKLVVSENVADVGGLRCALEAAKTESDVDLKLFFNNWARVWRLKSTQEFTDLLLSTDVHSPGPLRANVHAQNMDEFYPTFGVEEGMGMWLEPEKRVNIW
ncbi:M13-type metalloendopeptidase [Lactobacillus terrae]|uniref:M13 family metallopeptidase n=1 Tax=Lactobacillus terrae TaxID=2269374 RepID=UPI000C1B64CA